MLTRPMPRITAITLGVTVALSLLYSRATAQKTIWPAISPSSVAPRGASATR